ncbi:MAG: hypothetical protein ACERKZ_02430 [Lachnotalea sp.]
MIIKVETLTSMDEFKGKNIEILSMKLDAIENLIRSYTNNNFQNRIVRMVTPIIEGKILGRNIYMKIDDTVQISQSLVNDGLFVITEIEENAIILKGELYDSPVNTITKVVYPPDVKKGVIDMMVWEQENRNKVGIKSESISRHSVTYYDQDANNQVMGYPVSLLGFLKPYMKARF